MQGPSYTCYISLDLSPLLFFRFQAFQQPNPPQSLLQSKKHNEANFLFSSFFSFFSFNGFLRCTLTGVSGLAVSRSCMPICRLFVFGGLLHWVDGGFSQRHELRNSWWREDSVRALRDGASSLFLNLLSFVGCYGGAERGGVQ